MVFLFSLSLYLIAVAAKTSSLASVWETTRPKLFLNSLQQTQSASGSYQLPNLDCPWTPQLHGFSNDFTVLHHPQSTWPWRTCALACVLPSPQLPSEADRGKRPPQRGNVRVTLDTQDDRACVLWGLDWETFAPRGLLSPTLHRYPERPGRFCSSQALVGTNRATTRDIARFSIRGWAVPQTSLNECLICSLRVWNLLWI